MTYKEKLEEVSGLELTPNGIGSIYLGGRQLSNDCVDCWFKDAPIDKWCMEVSCKTCWNKEYCGEELKLEVSESIFMG